MYIYMWVINYDKNAISAWCHLLNVSYVYLYALSLTGSILYEVWGPPFPGSSSPGRPPVTRPEIYF